MEIIELDGRRYRAVALQTEHSVVLAIHGAKGFLSCGYIDTAVADRLGDAVAVVTGVRSYTDMLDSNVVRLSTAAAALGIEKGWTGRDVLRIFGSIDME